jgi:hypothetical protein
MSKANSGKIPTHLYHVTRNDNAENIEENGLHAQVSQAVSNDSRFDRNTEVVYGFRDKQDAIDFANDNGMEGEYSLYRVDTSGLTVKPDPEYDAGVSFVVIGDVDSSKITRVN